MYYILSLLYCYTVTILKKEENEIMDEMAIGDSIFKAAKPNEKILEQAQQSSSDLTHVL